jgi:alpha-L-rhamnosidase
LHIRNTTQRVLISDIGMRRREYPFTNPLQLKCSDKRLEKLFSACLNTIYNNTQETIVDGMGRERQQYSGDLGHMVHAIFRGFGEVPILARFINTYSQGITNAGFFLDTWPAYDRLCRLAEREIGITEWGPLLDHGVGFNFDCLYYYQYTADKSAFKEVYPRLKKFFSYIKNLQKADGTMPVEDLGIPTVWIDHTAYKAQKHKECAFSLYVAAMCLQALPVLAEAMNEPDFGKEVAIFGNRVLDATRRKFWDTNLQTWVCNKPWQQAEGEKRYCDRSLAMGIFYDLNPEKQNANSIKILAEKPSNLGLSYVTNAIWRFWALAKDGRMDIILNELRNQWYNSPAVQKNNTMAEWMEVKPDSHDQWSHASISPMFLAYMEMAGIKPLKVGYSEVEISPQLGDLVNLALTNYTIHGGIEVDFTQNNGKLEAKIKLPQNVSGWLVWNTKRIALKSGNNVLVV